MKHLIFAVLFIFLGNTFQAQSSDFEETKVYDKQIGINVTQFVLTFFSFDEPNFGTPSILVLYKKNKNGKRKRYGFGARLSWEQQSDNDKIFSSSVSFNFGREIVRQVGKKWKPYLGYETSIRGGYSSVEEELFDGEKEKTFTRSANVGFKVLTGLEFQLNDRLTLLTETSYGISFNYFLRRDLPSIRESYSANTFYVPPTSLILSYHF